MEYRNLKVGEVLKMGDEVKCEERRIFWKDTNLFGCVMTKELEGCFRRPIKPKSASTVRRRTARPTTRKLTQGGKDDRVR